jgi:hypothetical protein
LQGQHEAGTTAVVLFFREIEHAPLLYPRRFSIDWLMLEMGAVAFMIS